MATKETQLKTAEKVIVDNAGEVLLSGDANAIKTLKDSLQCLTILKQFEKVNKEKTKDKK